MSDGVYVYQFVTKHGSHNQASHGHGKGSVGGGGGGEAEREAKLQAAGNELNAKEAQAKANYKSAGAGDSPRAKEMLGEADGHAAVRASLGSKDKMDYTAGKARANATGASTASSMAYADGFLNAVNAGVSNYGDLSR